MHQQQKHKQCIIIIIWWMRLARSLPQNLRVLPWRVRDARCCPAAECLPACCSYNDNCITFCQIIHRHIQMYVLVARAFRAWIREPREDWINNTKMMRPKSQYVSFACVLCLSCSIYIYTRTSTSISVYAFYATDKTDDFEEILIEWRVHSQKDLPCLFITHFFLTILNRALWQCAQTQWVRYDQRAGESIWPHSCLAWK